MVQLGVTQLKAMGVPEGPLVEEAMEVAEGLRQRGWEPWEVRDIMAEVAADPAGDWEGLDRELGWFARSLETARRAEAGEPVSPWRQWGDDIDDEAIRQMERATSLPVAVQGALMPDAHRGYGLPIGGVLATDDAVIPYAVGMDIACRMKMSVYRVGPEALDKDRTLLERALEYETRFGVGADFDKPRDHPVMEEDWGITEVTRKLYDRARRQLGSSGSGNHFAEFGVLELSEGQWGLAPGRYVALLTHSGSRGPGAEVAKHYASLARRLRPELGKPLNALAWLELSSDEGQQYWRAMELMGRYAQANHEVIHEALARLIGWEVVAGVENHHNFAWREEYGGRTLVVHRKGATPAQRGQWGIIPGSMTAPAYVVRGKGKAASLRSAAHGAGRQMSRRQAKKKIAWPQVERRLEARGVRLLSAGLDEAPMVYKDIDRVMAEQRDLVESVAAFHPRIVKMAP